MERISSRVSRKPLLVAAHLAVIAALLALIAWFDHYTNPLLMLSILYFIPITYAAWTLGRPAALVTALACIAPTYTVQIRLVSAHVETHALAVANSGIRLLVYLFVAEITSRLVISSNNIRLALANLQELNAELNRVHTRLSDDMNAGGRLQAAMLKFNPPALGKCSVGGAVKYSQMVGGDFMDAGVLNGHIYVCVADIAGKGTSAALFTTLLKYLLQDAQQAGLRAGALVGSISSTLNKLLPDDRFVSLFYAEIDPECKRVEYVNAGHPDGLVFRRRTGKICALQHTAPILGVPEITPAIGVSSFALETGDVLVLYTDGATESRKINGEMIGEEFIYAQVRENANLSAQAMAESICSHIESATDAESRDDMTILCVKVDNAASK